MFASFLLFGKIILIHNILNLMILRISSHLYIMGTHGRKSDIQYAGYGIS